MLTLALLMPPMVREARPWLLPEREQVKLFAPMNSSGTFEPLVFATRLDAIEYDLAVERMKK
jgi:hypothetical protein